MKAKAAACLTESLHVPHTPRKTTQCQVDKNVWIVGDSYIRRGEERARETMGTSLGLDARVQWFGWGGLRWERLLPFIHQSLRGRAAPDVLLIHCGGNDLGNTKSLRLVADMKRDL
ncbi:hypothetical protein SKAU_G00398710 [Synaphobranchus kaupii]|uniref:SGNH hydrolase-type esterase domain-containing protein n=1 Tax=Synaphobranchus kaupii TaxID=118154 RepID=A0A9Q1IC58_SYNKA|nr:hypothetical protein SKAU_G00398710 [Synaphobranchus kaupii]